MAARSERAGLGNPPNGNAPRPPGACRVLMIGDMIGKPGRIIVERELAAIRDERGIDFVTANGENVAGGMGLTPSTADALLAAGVDVITSGNHIWDKREIYPYLEPVRARPAAAQLRHPRRARARLGHLRGARRHGARGRQPPGPDVHAADRQPVHRRRPAPRRGVRTAAAGPDRGLPLRADVREERDGDVPRRARERRRRHAHAHRHGRRADPPQGHRLPDRPGHDRAAVERDRVRPGHRAPAVRQRAADALRGRRRTGDLQRVPGRRRSRDRPCARRSSGSSACSRSDAA